MAIIEGTSILSTNLASKMNRSLKDFGLSEGDTVMVAKYNFSDSSAIFRIKKDSLPCRDAVFGQAGRSYMRYGSRTPSYRLDWVLPKKRTAIPRVRLYGAIELVPIFNFSLKPARKHTLPYDDIASCVKKVDITFIGRKFAEFQIFMNDEIKRLSGEDETA